MSKTKPKRQSSIPKKSSPKESKTEQAPEVEKEFDFGGLPQRDLKKNLGCG